MAPHSSTLAWKILWMEEPGGLQSMGSLRVGHPHHFMGNRWGNSGNCQTLFFGAPKSLQMVIAAMKLKDTYSLEEKL